MNTSVSSQVFGVLPSGEPVECWTLKGSGGAQLDAITYGAAITRLIVPDRQGRLGDVVLGFNNLDSYRANRAYIGAMVGRVAGRITGARFNLDGKDYQLGSNEAPNHLHGGVKGFDKRIWTAAPVTNPWGAPSLRLSYHSADGEEGYPGAMDAAIMYTVTGNNVIRVDTEVKTDKASPVSLTQHSYFNLAGEGISSITEHELEIFADEFIPVDENCTLLGRVESVSGGGNDFRQPRNLGGAIPHLFKHHGDLYLTGNAKANEADRKLLPVARLMHRESGRMLEVATTETHLQLYTGDGLDASMVGKSGIAYGPYAGLCLECEGYPDGANTPSLGDIILRPGRTRRETTTYAFSTFTE